MTTAATDAEAPTGAAAGRPGPGGAAGEHAPASAKAPLVIWLLAASAFVMILNETIMSVALPVLIHDLSITVATAQWLTSGFLLVMAVVIPITGYLLQRFTPRQVYLAAMTLFVLGTLICALAPGFPVLMAGRVVQASGTAVMIPLLMTSAIRLIPPEHRGATMGTVSLAIGVAPAIGPTISGVILSSLSWRWMFWIVLPIALVALAAGARWLRVATERKFVPLDQLSVLLSAVAFGGLLYGMSSVGESARGETPVPPWIPTVVGVVALVLFVLRQIRLQRADRALLDLRPLTHRTFTVSLVLIMLSMMALIGSFMLLPLYLQNILHASTFVTGLAILPGGLSMALLGTVVGRLYDRLGARPLVIPGAVLIAVAQWLFSTLGAGSAVWMVIAIHMVLMIGVAFILTPLMSDSLGQLPPGLDSHGSAILATLQQFAGAVGTALFATVTVVASASAAGVDAGGMRTAFLCAAILATLAVLVALMVRRRPVVATPPTTATPVETSTGEHAPVAAATAPPAAPAARPAADAGPGLFGMVSQGDGRGVERAVITVTDPDGRQQGRTSTGPDGGFSIELARPGRYLVIATSGSYQPQAGQVTVAGSPVRHDVSFSGGAAVAGVVRTMGSADGNGSAARAVLTLLDARGDVVGSGATDADGGYRLAGIPGGSYTLTATSPGHQPVATSIRLDDGGTTRRDLDLVGRSRLVGAVVSASSGRGVAEATATLIDHTATVVGSAVTEPDGSFVIDDLPAGTYTLTASGHLPLSQLVHIEAGAQASTTVALDQATPATVPTPVDVRATR